MSDTSADRGLIGQTIASQFTILRQLGAGGMGTVYLAEQVGMDRKVVVKVMHPELTAGSPTAAERFKREARAVAQLNHPNIVQIHVFGQADNGQMYIAMEYIDGRDLTKELAHGRMPEVRCLKIMDQVCSALIEAHSAGIVHRDLKPDNVMLTDRHGNPDYAKVLDFGIAKMAEAPDAATLTQAGSIFGTPRYMAPEQARGEHIDARTDIYTTGIILYEMLTGAHPFPSTTAVDYIVKHATEPVTPPSQAFADFTLNPRVEALVQRCTEKDPARRFQSARELQKEIRVALREFSEAARGFPTHEPSDAPADTRAATVARTPTATSTGPASALPRPARSGVSPVVWAVCGLLVAAGIVLAVVFGLPRDRQPEGDGVVAAAAGDKAGETAAEAAAEGQPVDGERHTEAAHAGDPEHAAVAERPATDEDRGGAAAAPADTDIAEAQAIDGFPIPAGLRVVAEMPQAMVYESDHAAADLLGFFRAKLAGRYSLSEIPNGLMVGGNSPFNIVSVTSTGDATQLAMTRNATWQRPAGEAPASAPAAAPATFGVEAPPGATVSYKMPEVVGYRVRKPMSEVCDWFVSRYGQVDGALMVMDMEADPPYCNMVRGTADVTWQAISIIPDATSPGAIMAVVTARQ